MAAPDPVPSAGPGPAPAPGTGLGPADHLANARSFPAGVPVLVDSSAGITLRAHGPEDVPAVVEQSRDPQSRRWTTVPTPEGGYTAADAEAYLALVATGWRTGAELGWAIEDGHRGGSFGGSIDLRLAGDGMAEVGFGLHPAARGRHLMSAALRLVRDYAFDRAGLQTLRWRAVVGNWPSRRVAAAAGFAVDGSVRRALLHRGTWQDGWFATLTADDPREPRPWFDPPVLATPRLRLRAFGDDDAERVVQACRDLRTQHWLVSLPRPYRSEHAQGYLDAVRELGATCTGYVWCLTGPDDDRCLGSVSLEGFGGYARRAEIGYWSHPAGRGRGLMTEAVRLVTDFATERAGVDSVLIRSAAGNRASRHVAVAAGYREVGVLHHAEPLGDGTVDDLVLYARP